jgi:hypothetical protein
MVKMSQALANWRGLPVPRPGAILSCKRTKRTRGHHSCNFHKCERQLRMRTIRSMRPQTRGGGGQTIEVTQPVTSAAYTVPQLLTVGTGGTTQRYSRGAGGVTRVHAPSLKARTVATSREEGVVNKYSGGQQPTLETAPPPWSHAAGPSLAQCMVLDDTKPCAFFSSAMEVGRGVGEKERSCSQCKRHRAQPLPPWLGEPRGPSKAYSS